MSFNLLLIEDDYDLGLLLEAELSDHNYQVFWAQSLAAARVAYAQQAFDLAIVDLLLPDGRGFEFVKESNCPIVMMSALSDPENRLEGVELGAIDFIPKPFLVKELVIKLERILTEKKVVIEVGQLKIDMVRRQIIGLESTVFLNRRDFKLLEVLINNAPKVVSRDEIIDYVYGKDQNPSHRTIDNAVVGLRQLLNDTDYAIIRSVRGEGYQWGLEKE